MFEYVKSMDELQKIFYDLHHKFETEKEENMEWRIRINRAYAIGLARFHKIPVEILEDEETKEDRKLSFLNDLNNFPEWVRSKEDIITYCKHIKYRMLQSKAKLNRIFELVDLGAVVHDELIKIQLEIDEFYKNEKQK